jgi:hypothetical protein
MAGGGPSDTSASSSSCIPCARQWSATTERTGGGGQAVGNSEMTAFAEFGVAVRLGLQLPSIFRRRRRPFWGFRLGTSSQPRCRAASGAGGGRRGRGRPPPRPSDFCVGRFVWGQLLGGRGPLGLPTRRAKWAKSWFALGSWRHSEISSRRADRAAT